MNIEKMIEEKAKAFIDEDVKIHDHLLYPDIGAIERGYIAGANYILSTLSPQGEAEEVDWATARDEARLKGVPEKGWLGMSADGIFEYLEKHYKITKR